MPSSIYQIAVEAAQKQVDALLAAQERLATALSDTKQRWSILRSKLIDGLIDGTEPKDGRAQVVGLAADYHLLNDTLQKLSVFTLPDAEVELERAKINLQKAEADSALAKAMDEIAKMDELVSELKGVRIDVSGTQSNADRVAATHAQQAAADAEKRLQERLIEIASSKNSVLAAGFLQSPR